MTAWRTGSLAAVTLAVASVAVAVSAVGDPLIDRAASVDAPAVRLDPPEPVLVVGDSAIAALRWVPGARNAVIGFDHVLDLESCRRLVVESCVGREGRRPLTALETVRAARSNYTTLVVSTGYNDPVDALAVAFPTIVHQARSQGIERIVWFTLRTDVDYVGPGGTGNHAIFSAYNAALRALAASGTYPDVELADWATYTAGRPDWFVTDGVHYRTIAAWGVADYLSRKLAFLDGRACPLPTTRTGTPDRPCPDPDDTGLVADIAGLYPIGQEGVLCYEVGDDRHVECRYETRVIRLSRLLVEGDSGPDVAALQNRLTRLGFPVEPDGVFGELVRKAVESFQAAAGLPVTGAADRPTLAALGFDVSAVP
jgi:hypothetical protein